MKYLSHDTKEEQLVTNIKTKQICKVILDYPNKKVLELKSGYTITVFPKEYNDWVEVNLMIDFSSGEYYYENID